MITNTGKKIITKYLIGQVPSYASYIALGCGASPLLSSASLGDYSEKTNLDFEMFRVPVTSRGYIVENGKQKIVLTAQLPAEERYDITEIGLYPAISNPVATGFDSRTLYSFNTNEIWERHIGSNKGIIPKVTERLDPTGQTLIIPKLLISSSGTIGSVSGSGPYTTTITGLSSITNIVVGDTITWNGYSGIATVTAINNLSISISSTTSISSGIITSIYNTNLKMFQANADNITFEEIERLKRFERPRFSNNAIFIRGDSCSISDSFALTGTNHIHLNNVNIDLSKNSPLDELKIAFSVINKDSSSTSDPSKVKIIVEFTDADGLGLSTTIYARAEIKFVDLSVDAINGVDMGANRYFVSTIPLKDLNSGSFSWNAVKSIKIYSSIESSGTASSDYYLALDAIRIENISSISAVYGLTGYSVIVNKTKDPDGTDYAIPVAKESNTSNYIEFRFIADVT